MSADASKTPSPFGEMGYARGSIRFEPGGMRLSRRRSTRSQAGAFYPYADITHIEVGTRAVWVGLSKNTLVLRRKYFVQRDGPERLAHGLARAIALQPGGAAQWERIQQVDRLAAQAAPRIATTGVVVLCIVLMALQLLDPFVQDIGSFAPELFVAGEWWRLVSANLLHSLALFPIHLVVNVILILGFAFLVERPLGPLRTLLLMALSGIGAMSASFAAGYTEVIGASGIAAGLVGAELALELHFARRLPASWRLSRPFFLTVLLLQGAIDLILPLVAAAAHLGGFVVGYVVARVLAPGALSRRAPSRRLRMAAVAVALFVVASLVAPIPILLRDGGALSRHAMAMLSTRDLPAFRYNDLAWRMATESRLTPGQTELAIALAERAVSETSHQNPDVLDTLAEALFVAGDSRGALSVIDEAIGLAEGETYFVEQRRRFTGERDADDRPDPPALPWVLRKPQAPAPVFVLDPSNGVEI